MTKEEGAKIMAVKYVLDYNTFRKSEKLKEDLTMIRAQFMGDEEYNRLFEKYCEELRGCKDEMPRWARLIMAEKYALNV